MRRTPVNLYTIERIMEIDLPIGEKNDSGVFTHPFIVKVMVSEYAHILIKLARSENGFHYGVSIETLTGCSMFAPSERWNCYKRKIEALEAALHDIKTNQMARRYRSAIETARRELNKYRHEQLTLF